MELPASEDGLSGALVFVIKLDGEFDVSDCGRLREAFSIPTTADLVVVDFQAVSYIDSSVLKCLLELRQRTARRGAKLALVGVTNGVSRILEICQFNQLFDVQGSFAEMRRSGVCDGADLRMLTLVSRSTPTGRA